MKIDELNIEDLVDVTWEEIKKKYKFSENDAVNALKKGEYTCTNFWTPYEENSYSEEDVLKVKELFLKKFPDIIIHSQNDPKYMEFYLDTLEKHRFIYSLIITFEQCKLVAE